MTRVGPGRSLDWDWSNFPKLNILFHLNINTASAACRLTVTMDPPTDEHQHRQLSNRKSKKGSKDEEGSSRNTAEGEDTSQEKKKASTGKKYNLFLTSLFISREVLLRIVVFLIVYLVLTRLVKLFTKEKE